MSDQLNILNIMWYSRIRKDLNKHRIMQAGYLALGMQGEIGLSNPASSLQMPVKS